jgi:hypothetical protein
MDDTELQAFVKAYIEAALIASTDDDCEPLDASFGFTDLPAETIAALTKDCHIFAKDTSVAHWLAIAIDIDGYSVARAGHDFWLTRNGHGAGYWDRDLGDVGEKLTDCAHVYGERYLYVGDDGKVYVA